MYFASFQGLFTAKLWWICHFVRLRPQTGIMSIFIFYCFVFAFFVELCPCLSFFSRVMAKFNYQSIKKVQAEKAEKTKAEKEKAKKAKVNEGKKDAEAEEESCLLLLPLVLVPRRGKTLVLLNPKPQQKGKGWSWCLFLFLLLLGFLLFGVRT